MRKEGNVKRKQYPVIITQRIVGYGSDASISSTVSLNRPKKRTTSTTAAAAGDQYHNEMMPIKKKKKIATSSYQLGGLFFSFKKIHFFY